MTDLKKGQDLNEHLKNIKDKEEADKRAKDCEIEIIAALNKYNCGLDAIMVTSRAGNEPRITIIAKSNV